MGAFLVGFAQICSRERGPKAREVQEAMAAKVEELEAELSKSRQALAESQRAQMERVERLEAELSQSRHELAESRQALAEKQRGWEEEREAITSGLETKLATASQELHDCEQALASLRLCIETANVPIVSVDCSGLIQDWNSKAMDVFASKGYAAIGRRMAEAFHEEDYAGFLELQAAVLSADAEDAHGGHFQHQLRTRSHSEGNPWHEVLIFASPRRSAVGTLEGALYIGHDLTKSSREVLDTELTVQDLHKLIRTVNAPIIGVDQRGCVDEWNKKAELLTGFSREEALGKSFLKNFVTEDFADLVQAMLAQSLKGQEIHNFEFSILAKGGQWREILWSSTARRNQKNEVVEVIGIGQDITELRSESKMLEKYVRICGAAVWSLRGNALTGAVSDSKTKEIEHLISQQAQMDLWDPRMVLWRASFVSILKTMCQNFWMGRKRTQGSTEKAGHSSTEITTDFVYDFSFEAPNGSVKWYKVQGHLIQECLPDSQFEVTGSMQEVTSMLIDKVVGDRWQKWWNRMCHMVFDATLLVDTQEYRVLNAWGEEKVFGCKLQSNHPLLQLIKHDDTVSLKEAFNEVTFKGFERGRTLHLQRPGSDKDMPAQCFLLSADQENPNECMMGIRMQVSGPTDDDVSVLWDVAKPNPVLTLEDLARLKSGLKRSHRRPSRNVRISRSTLPWPPHRSRSSDPHTSSHSLSSIPEDLHGEFEEDDLRSVSDRGSEIAEDTENDTSSKSSNSSNCSDGSISEVGVCNSSPACSASEEHSNPAREGSGGHVGDWSNPFGMSPELQPRTKSRKDSQPKTLRNKSPPPTKARASTPPVKKKSPVVVRTGPALVNLRWCKRTFSLNLDDFSTIAALRAHVQEITGVTPVRQTLILAGRRLPKDDESLGPSDPSWNQLRVSVRPGQTLMLIGSALAEPTSTAKATHGASAEGAETATSACASAGAGATQCAAAEAEPAPPPNVEALDD